MPNMTVKNGVSGILVPLSFFSSEALEPVLINTQIAVYCDNRDAILDVEGIKNWIKSFQEEAQSKKDSFSPFDFIEAFHKEHSKEHSRLSMLLGYFFKGRTFPISISIEYDGKYHSITTQVVYTDQPKQQTMDVKLFSLVAPNWEKVINLLSEAVPHLDGDSLNIAETAFYVKERIEKEVMMQVKEVFIKNGANITIIGE